MACGITGVIGTSDNLLFLRLLTGAIRHRGNGEGSGVMVFNQTTVQRHAVVGKYKELFDTWIDKTDKEHAEVGIAHLRYATSGSNSSLSEVSPLTGDFQGSPFAVSHNGNIPGYRQLRVLLEARGYTFTSNVDSEVIVALISLAPVSTLSEAVEYAIREINEFTNGEAAISVIVATHGTLILACEGRKYHPLVYGRLGLGWVASSETRSMDRENLQAQDIRPVLPGQIVVIRTSGLQTIQTPCAANTQHCVIEYFYYARPDSIIFGDGRTVGDVRREIGKQLAKLFVPKRPNTIVVGLPASALPFAEQAAEEWGHPFVRVFIRDPDYPEDERSFMQPTQAARADVARKKLAANLDSLLQVPVIILEDDLDALRIRITEVLRECVEDADLTGLLSTIQTEDKRASIVERVERLVQNLSKSVLVDNALLSSLGKAFTSALIHVVLIDDTLMRGTTLRENVGRIKDHVASVYFVSAAPMVVNSCEHGVDIAEPMELLATQCEEDTTRIAKEIGVNAAYFPEIDILQVIRPMRDSCHDCMIRE
jgi:amidophosphoribosyltransferase